MRSEWRLPPDPVFQLDWQESPSVSHSSHFMRPLANGSYLQAVARKRTLTENAFLQVIMTYVWIGVESGPPRVLSV